MYPRSATARLSITLTDTLSSLNAPNFLEAIRTTAFPKKERTADRKDQTARKYLTGSGVSNSVAIDVSDHRFDCKKYQHEHNCHLLILLSTKPEKRNFLRI